MDIDGFVSHLQPPFGTSKGTRAIYIMVDITVSWFGPIPPIGCQGTQNGYQNNVDNESVGATAPANVAITVYNKVATTSVEDDEGNHLWW